MQDKMTDYPHPRDAPSVDVFTADELLVLSEWFDVEHPRLERSVENILDEWDIPQDISEYRRLDASVAQILLERVRITFRSGPRSLTTAFSSPCDIALGSFGPETPAGLVGEVDANAWADKVWSDHPDDQD
jgi:hypothetical protein